MTSKKKECEYCGEVIDDKKQTYVLLATITPKKDRQDSFFHMECFKKNHEEKVRKKAKAIVENMRQQAQAQLQSIIGVGFGGFGNTLGAMLNPLANNRFSVGENTMEDDLENPFDQLNKKPKKENGKRKRKQKT